MALYSRLLPDQARATNLVHTLLEAYREVTVGQLMRDNNEFLKDTSSVLAAIDLLQEEKKVRLEKFYVHPDKYLDGIKVYCLAG